MTVTRIRKKFQQLFIPIQAMQAVTESRLKETTSKRLSTYLAHIYLFKLYGISIILLLTNNLTNTVLCNVDQDHQMSVIIVDHSRKFKDI